MTLPNFLIIGAAKSGTTALYHYLNAHPQIYMSPVKEPKFFALEGEKINFGGPRDYVKDYITDLEIYENLFNNVQNEIAIGEASPWYLHSPKAAKRIKYYIPNCKLIAILRNPIDRAYSQFLSLVQRNFEPLSDFSQALKLEQYRKEQNWSPRWFYKDRGFYYEQLNRYFDNFEREQIKIYLYEDLKNNSQKVVQDIFQFLEVNDTFRPNLDRKHNVTSIPKNKILDNLLNNVTIKSMLRPLLTPNLRQSITLRLRSLNFQEKPPLKPELRQELINEYREDILKLQDLIQRDLSKWLTI